MLSEIRQRQILYDIPYMWDLKKKKYNKPVNVMKKKIHRYRVQTGVYQWEEGRGKIGVENLLAPTTFY